MKLKRIDLLAAIFGELQDLIPSGSVTTEELLQAAQSLIDLSKNEYIARPDTEPTIRSNYFSHDVSVAFLKYQRQIINNETKLCTDYELTRENEMALKNIISGSASDMYLEVSNG